MPDMLEQCAIEMMETVPQVMKAIRTEMRLGRGANISVPQFRVLRYIQRRPDSALSDLAEHLGLTPPSVSKLVDGLVKQNLIQRQDSASDRRRLRLALTPEGETLVNRSRASAQASLAQTLSGLPAGDLETVLRALEILQPLFSASKPPIPPEDNAQ